MIKEKGFNNNFTIPAPPPGAQKIIDDGVSPKPSGKIIDISDYSVNHKVTDVDGKTLSNLAVKPLSGDEINTPSSSSGSGSSESGNAAPTLAPQGSLSAATIVIPAMIALSFTAGFTLF